MTLRTLHLSGLAAWALVMALLFAVYAVISGDLLPTTAVGGGSFVTIAGYDTVVRYRNGGEFPDSVRHTVAASVVTGVLAVAITVAAFLSMPEM